MSWFLTTPMCRGTSPPSNVARDLLYVYCALHDWPNAKKTSQRLLALTPDSLNAKIQAGYVDFWETGSIARLKKELASVPVGKDPDGSITATRMDANLIDRNPTAAEQDLNSSSLETFSFFNGVDTPRSYFAGTIALLRNDATGARP